MAKNNIGPKNGFWKGGRVVASNGYVLIRVGKSHPLADSRGYAYEHRIVAERKLGRSLNPGEIVHHIDGNKQNNSIENLNVVPGIAHHSFEHRSRSSNSRHPDEPNVEIKCFCGCGTTLDKYDPSGRPRGFISGHNMRVSNG
jgi:hypothetical protein